MYNNLRTREEDDMKERIIEFIKDHIDLIRIDNLKRKVHVTPKRQKGIKYTKRKQQVKRQIILGGVLFGLLIVLAITYNTKAAGKKKAQEAAKARQQNEEIQKGVDKAAEKMEDSELGTIAENETAKQRLKRVRTEAKSKGYPKDIIALLSKNKETVDFVENYEKNKDNPIAEVVADDLKKGEIPQLLQWDERWGYSSYGTGFVATCGCGPTCMSMVISGLTGDASVTPAVVADYSEREGYIDADNNTYWSLMSEAGEHWNITCYEGTTSEDYIADELSAGHPIICSVGPGDFTKKGHFIVLTKYKNGKVKVNDPFSKKNSKKTWVYAGIKDQIKALWVYKAD